MSLSRIERELLARIPAPAMGRTFVRIEVTEAELAALLRLQAKGFVGIGDRSSTWAMVVRRI